MKKFVCKALSILLAAMMLLTAMPLSASAAEEEKLTFSVSEKAANPGETVDIDIAMTHNTGISSVGLDVSYDSNILAVESISFNPALGGVSESSPLTNNPAKIIWIGATGNYQGDAVVATIRFRVSENAEGEQMSVVSLSYDPDDIYDVDENNVNCDVVNGGVYVTPVLAGDINGDTKVNNKDVTRLLQYLAKWQVEVCRAAIDVNADGKVNNKDVSRLMKYLARWDVMLYLTPPQLVECAHSLTQIEAVAPTCEETGNSTYWRCESCGKCFADAGAVSEIRLEDTVIEATGHTPEVIPAVEPTATTPGSTEGARCSVCGKILVEPQPIAPQQPEEYSIIYHLYGGDEYLMSVGVNNPNPETFSSENELRLRNLRADGYVFDGWYDGVGANSTLVKKIPAGTTGVVELYARWTPRMYTITFNDTLTGNSDSLQYSVNESVTLPVREWYGYSFLGWSDESAGLVESIPVGTTGNITLYANWTSGRSAAYATEQLNDPIVYEDEKNGQYLFAYDIGSIENVPLFTIENFGCSDDFNQQWTVFGTGFIKESNGESIADIVANATTRSSAWTLPDDWNAVDITSPPRIIDGQTPYMVTTGDGSFAWYLNHAMDSATVTLPSGLTGKIYKPDSSSSFAVQAVPLEIDSTDVVGTIPPFGNENAEDIGGSFGNSIIDHPMNSRASTGSVIKYWNVDESYEKSAASAASIALSDSLNELLPSAYSANGVTGSLVCSTLTENEYAAALSYFTDEIGIYYNFAANHLPAGYYRVVAAGNVHVFAVVGFDIATRSYYTYSYGVLDYDFYPYLDYSRVTPYFNDYENGALPFSVPIEVDRFIDNAMTFSQGLQIDINSGTVVGYTGADQDVVVPEYMSVTKGDGTSSAVKITAISPNAFANSSVTSVVLGSHIQEIPGQAFINCSQLWGVDCPNVTRIGASAFKSCTALAPFTVTSKMTDVGENAFMDVPEITVYTKDESVANAAIHSGAKRVTVTDLSKTGGSFSDAVIGVPSSVDYFCLNGRGSAYQNMKLFSAAAETVLDHAAFSNQTGTPLHISSGKLTLKCVSAESAGNALALSADPTEIELYGENTLTSQSGDAVVSKSIALSASENTIANGLTVAGDIRICGSITGTELLNQTSGSIIIIDDEAFALLQTDESGWVSEQDAPSDAVITDAKWTYTETEFLESQTSNVPGYTLYDKKIIGYGAVEGPFLYEPYSSEDRRVRSEQRTVAGPIKTIYHYYRYANSPYEGAGSNRPSASGSYYFTYDLDYPLTDYGEVSNNVRGYRYYNASGGYITVWACDPLTTQETEETIQIVWYYQPIYYEYYYYREVDKESFTEIQSGENIRNIQKWVKYLL